MEYPEEMDEILNRNIEKLITWIKQRRGPFAPDFIEAWTNRYHFYREIQDQE